MDHDRIARASVLAVTFAAAAALAQPAPNANPNAFKKRPLNAECQALRDDYLRAKDLGVCADLFYCRYDLAREWSERYDR